MLPFNDLREVLRDETLVIWPELLRVNRIVTLAVEVVRVECPDCLESTLVVCVGQVLIGVLTMPAVSPSRTISEV